MIVKLIAPGIIPGDYVTADLPGVPQIGHTITVEWYQYPDAETTAEMLTVKSVVWSIEIAPGQHHAVTDADGRLPEVVCERTEDAWRAQMNSQTSSSTTR